MMEVATPLNKSLTSMLFTVNERSQGVAKTKGIMGIEMEENCGIFCSRFHLILSPLKIILALEMVSWFFEPILCWT